MPTEDNRETIGERLTRLRAELIRVRAVIERSENNGVSFNISGHSVTQIQIDRAQKREERIKEEIRNLEARLNGSKRRSRAATIVTKNH